MPASLPYGLLRQTNPNYRAEDWDMLDDFYEGGFRMARASQKHISRIYGESEERYRDRVACTAYVNYFGQVVDYFVAAVFTKDISVCPAADADNDETPGGLPDDEFYEQFAADCDLRGTTFAQLLRRALTTALCKRTAYVAVDMPAAAGAVAATRLEEERMGLLRAYAYELTNEELLDWNEDADGKLRWAILNRQTVSRPEPESSRGEVIEEFKIWRLGDNGRAFWELYRTAYAPGKEPRADVEIPLVDAGETSFARIPIVKLELPHGLSVGDKIVFMAREHYQRRSALNAAQNKSLVSLPVARLGPEIAAMGEALPSDRQQDPYRGDDPIGRFQRQGFIVIGKDDRIEFAEPQGTAYELTYRQVRDLKDELFRVVHQMAASVDNSTSTMRRSGESKKMDRSAEAIVLSALGEWLRAFAVEIYETLAEARGEYVVWAAHGLQGYETEARPDMVTEAIAMDQVNIPSVTFKRAYKTAMAQKLMPNLPPETQEQIRKEIEAGVSAEVEMTSLMGTEPELEASGELPIPPASASDVNLPDDEDDADDAA